MGSPTVTIVIVVYNRRDELREVLRRMLSESDYDPELVDVVVVDNGSSDGSPAMVRDEFPQVQLIARETNAGAPAWNDGFAVARGDYVLILDDDCYLPPDGLRRAVEAAERDDAALVSFKVVSTHDPDWVFTDRYRTGLLSFWGCAWLVRHDALDELGGYDPQIFMWTNELDFTIRLYDRGYRHLHLPEVAAQHMKRPEPVVGVLDVAGYRRNARNLPYVAAKLLRPRDLAGAIVALLTLSVRHALRANPRALAGIPLTLAGMLEGLRNRQAVGPELSRFYRENFHSFVNPARLARPLSEVVGLRRSGEPSKWRYDRFIAERERVYPREAALLDVRGIRALAGGERGATGG